MPITLHRNGIATALAPLTGAGAGKFAAGYQWPRRNLADTTLKYPFWSLDATKTQPAEDPLIVGAAGENLVRATTRILAFDRFEDSQARYDAFVALVEAALTALRADGSLQLGQASQGCILNRIVESSVTFLTTSTPALIVGTIVCQADYMVPRT